jgi:hypothetical protein
MDGFFLLCALLSHQENQVIEMDEMGEMGEIETWREA